MANQHSQWHHTACKYLLSGGLAMHWNYCEQLLHHFKTVINTTDIHWELGSVGDVCGLIKSD